MLDEIAKNIALQYGAIGLLVAVLILGNVIQWRRSTKQQDDYFEQSVQTTAALVELTIFIRGKK